MNYKNLWLKLDNLNPDALVPDHFPDSSGRTWGTYFRMCQHPYYLTGHYPNRYNRLTDVTEEEAQRFIDYFGEDKICEQPDDEELN